MRDKGKSRGLMAMLGMAAAIEVADGLAHGKNGAKYYTSQRHAKAQAERKRQRKSRKANRRNHR